MKANDGNQETMSTRVFLIRYDRGRKGNEGKQDGGKDILKRANNHRRNIVNVDVRKADQSESESDDTDDPLEISRAGLDDLANL